MDDGAPQGATLLMTNAAGGIRERMQPGDRMVIDNHISVFLPQDPSLASSTPCVERSSIRRGIPMIGASVMLSVGPLRAGAGERRATGGCALSSPVPATKVEPIFSSLGP